MGKPKTTLEFIEEATKLHNGRYIYSKSKYIDAWTKVIITCEVHGDFVQAPGNHLKNLIKKQKKGQGCPQCMHIEVSEKLKHTNEQIDSLLLINNLSVKRIGNYINNYSKIKWECLNCNNNWLASPNGIKGGRGCPKCNDTKLSNFDVDNYLIGNNLNIKRIAEYINAHTKINWQCLICEFIWNAKPHEIMRGFSKGFRKKSTKEFREGSGCPQCSRGKNEKRVGEVLDLLKISHEKIRIDLDNKKLFPDYYLQEFNYIIEYNGTQHYKPTCFGNMTNEQAIFSFENQKKRDELLRNYCYNKNINLLEIDGRKYKGNNLKNFVFEYFNRRAGRAE